MQELLTDKEIVSRASKEILCKQTSVKYNMIDMDIRSARDFPLKMLFQYGKYGKRVHQAVISSSTLQYHAMLCPRERTCDKMRKNPTRITELKTQNHNCWSLPQADRATDSKFGTETTTLMIWGEEIKVTSKNDPWSPWTGRRTVCPKVMPTAMVHLLIWRQKDQHWRIIHGPHRVCVYSVIENHLVRFAYVIGDSWIELIICEKEKWMPGAIKNYAVCWVEPVSCDRQGCTCNFFSYIRYMYVCKCLWLWVMSLIVTMQNDVTL